MNEYANFPIYQHTTDTSSTSFPNYRLTEYNVRQLIHERIKCEHQNIQNNVSSCMIKECVKFFKIDYGTGEDIIKLVNSDDASNYIIGVNMLLGEIKRIMKEEIINEINK